MYGTRHAARNWFGEYSDQLLKHGFHPWEGVPMYFLERPTEHTHIRPWGRLRQCRAASSIEVYAGNSGINARSRRSYSGQGRSILQEVRILNRVVLRNEQRGISYVADPRHLEIMTAQLDLAEANAVATPGAKEEGRTPDDATQPLDENGASQYGTLVAWFVAR